MLRLISMLNRFKRDEKGLALTEYLILLGLIAAAVIVAVTLFGQNLGIQWQNWADWIGSADLDPPTT